LAVSEEHYQLSLIVRECVTKIENMEKSIEVQVSELNVYLQEQRSRSFKKWEIVIVVFMTLAATLLSSILSKLLPA